MQTFKYSFIAKLIYRFANIPITILLFIIASFSLVGVTIKWYYIIPVLVDISLIYFLNRYYLKLYKQFPFKIEINTQKLICSDFFFSKKRFEIPLSEITGIRGGIFSGTIARPIYLDVASKGLQIGINQHVKGYNKLLTIILSNINQELYNSLLGTMQQISDENTKLKKQARKENQKKYKVKKKKR